MAKKKEQPKKDSKKDMAAKASPNMCKQCKGELDAKGKCPHCMGKGKR
jgi:hypothetical protein